MNSTAADLASWAFELEPTRVDLELAERSLLDTVAVALAARGHPLERVLVGESDAIRWGALGHVLDFDDLHMPSTAHVSVVCVMATLASGGGARAYLAGAGVMARLGTALGWSHYASGWHATCTAGAPGAAVCAGIALGLDRDQLADAIALSLPAASGVQRAFGTDGKSLQVGFAVDAGLRAARLVASGATADPRALDEWMRLVGSEREPIDFAGPAVPDGLAIKLYPCCYALQRPIAAVQELLSGGVLADDIVSVRVETPESTVQPLIHHRPMTSLEGKFSLEYAIAATLLDGYPGFSSFSDSGVQRDRSQELIRQVELVTPTGGDSLLSGEVAIEIRRANGEVVTSRVGTPPGAPSRPPSEEAMLAKLADCGDDVPTLLSGVDWISAREVLRRELSDEAIWNRSHAQVRA